MRNAESGMRDAFCIHHFALHSIMIIPYTVEARPDTGLHNGKLGIWLFLASEVMLFGALFSTYILLRVGASEGPHGELSVPLGTVTTIIHIASSLTIVVAWAALQ